MKTKDQELQRIWPELEDIFMDYPGLTAKVQKRLANLGWTSSKSGEHGKIYMKIHGKERMMVVSLSPSDKQAGRQILRQIRRMYENG